MALNSVVLPAPFGPISAQISPAPTRSETSFTAIRPPNRTVTSDTSSRAVMSLPMVAVAEAGMQSRHQAGKPVRQEQQDEDDQHAEHQFLKAREIEEDLRRGGDDDRADHRTGKAAEAAHHDHGEFDEQLGQVER